MDYISFPGIVETNNQKKSITTRCIEATVKATGVSYPNS